MKTVIKVAVVAVLMGSLAAGAFASPLNGIVTGNGRAPAFGSSSTSVYLVGNEATVVSIVGDGDTDLDIYVYDAAGRCIARGIGLTDREVIRFVPGLSGTYRVEIRNLGNVYNDFSIVIR